MRLFALLGILLIVAGTYLLVDGALRLSRCISGETFSLEIWSKHFWLAVPRAPRLGLSQNAHWFLRGAGGIASLALGTKVLRVATR